MSLHFGPKVKDRKQNKKVQNGGRIRNNNVGNRKIENLLKAKITRASKTNFLTFKAKTAFFSLQQAFTVIT